MSFQIKMIIYTVISYLYADFLQVHLIYGADVHQLMLYPIPFNYYIGLGSTN